MIYEKLEENISGSFSRVLSLYPAVVPVTEKGIYIPDVIGSSGY